MKLNKAESEFKLTLLAAAQPAALIKSGGGL
jgi:hypothetical protein